MDRREVTILNEPAQPAQVEDTHGADAREAFERHLQRGLALTASCEAPRRGGGAGAGLDAGEFEAADLLEVHFEDGSVFYTDPQDFRQTWADTPATRTGEADTAEVRLPFQLPLAGAGTATRGGSPVVAVQRYRLAKLTDRSALDQLYEHGARWMQRLDSWLQQAAGLRGGAAADPMARPSADAAGRAMLGICRLYEDATLQALPAEADGVLLHWTGSAWTPVGAGPWPPDPGIDEVLLLLHGTASSTRSSFEGLWRGAAAPSEPVAADWRALADDRRRLVLAFDHRTLSVSPLRNVLDLLDQLQALQLPARCSLQWLSHSRGGLVGELLALALGEPGEIRSRQAAVRRMFEQAYEPGHADRQLVTDFLQRLESGTGLPGWKPATFVRVACPARGTLLADRRTDLFLSLLLRSAGLAFGVNGNPWFEPLQGLVRSLVASRADARWIPGLEAMVPGAPLSLALNSLPDADQGGLTLPGRLRVVAGVSEDFGPAGLASMLGNVFYGLHDHDFVVHTHSMFGGYARADARSLRARHRSINHFGYFEPGSAGRASDSGDPHTRQQVLAALRGQDQAFKRMDEDEARTRGLRQQFGSHPWSRRQRSQWLADIAAAGAARKPILVVLPGIMGSELSPAGRSADQPVWLSAASMFSGALRGLDLDSGPPLEATGLLPLSYERLLDKARAQFHVVTFPYDWRKPIPTAAQALIDLLASLLPQADRLEVPVLMLAHSMGGLVARVALWCDGFGLKERRGDLTTRLQARGLRLLQCGTPNRGSYAPVQLLLQQHPLTRNIAVAARDVDPAALARFGARYPGLLAMLPDEKDPVHDDLFDEASWDRIEAEEKKRRDDQPRITRPEPRTLAQAAQVRAWLHATLDELKANKSVYYVAGHGLTPMGLKRLGGHADVPGVLRLGLTWSGDGTVPWNSRLLPERTWYVDTAHGSLLDEVEAFDGYFDLLLQGRTARLAATAPSSRAGLADESRMLYELPAPPSLPADPVAYVLGLRPQSRADTRPAAISVRVIHGSLDYARYPTLVGHYVDDGVYGAVSRIDAKLRGQFTRALGLGLFDGTARTSVYLRDSGSGATAPSYPGAIVVGLGRLSDLNPATLVDTVTRGVLGHAFEHMHQDAWVCREGDVRLRLSTVLIAAHSRALTVRESLAALLTGIRRAALLLADGASLPRRVRLDEIEIVELHETVALDAAYALDELLKRPEWQRNFCWPAGVLETREGGICGYRPPDESSQWQRLLVQADPMGSLHFELIADRARVESTQNRGDVFSLRQFIAGAADSGALQRADTREMDELGRVLFNLLLPQSLKQRLTNFQRTLLLVDDESARLPWELLAPPSHMATGEEARQPLAVQAGMLRQRLAGDFREDAGPYLRGAMGGEGVLVIGAPDTRGWNDEQGRPLKFADLPGAAEEALSVAALFADQGWDVQRLLRGPAPGQYADGASYKDVRWQLMRPRPWRVLHLAGHGLVGQWQRTVTVEAVAHPVLGTGMVLGEQQMLTAGFVELMHPVPEFVFINCCYSGVDAQPAGDAAAARPSGQTHHPAVASSLALAFIRAGCRAVVAAGWQVHDADGQLFATTFYEGLLAGHSFGEAVLGARRAVWRGGHARSNTWGAYQCYGDPNWRLTSASQGVSLAREAPPPGPLDGAHRCMSPRELADRIGQVTAQAGDIVTDRTVRAMKELIAQLQSDPARRAWLDDSLVLAGLGTAWRELGQTNEALRAFFRSLGSVDSKLTLEQLEHAANLVSKLTELPAGVAGDAPLNVQSPAATQHSIAALNQIDLMALALRWPGTAAPDAPIPPTAAAAERACLRGSAQARRAGAQDLDERAEERASWRLAAAVSYANGYRGFVAHGSPPAKRAYALSNALLYAALTMLPSDSGEKQAPEPAAGSLQWWNAGLGGAAGGREQGIADMLREVGTVLEALDIDAGLDFWGIASFLDLRIARCLMRVATSPPDETPNGDDIAALPALTDDLLLRWPSPGQLSSFIDRPALTLRELRSQRQPSESAKALAAALQTLVDTVQAAQRTLEG